MSLCRLVVLDFLHGTGRTDEEHGHVFYDEDDLQFARDYARGLIEEGHVTEPFLDLPLKEFAEWCERRRLEIESERV